ncbi:MAG: hypothetical protein IJG13_24645 [Kiritimatiellae bacterium]|nr:hypothetical protein [Kiritimatiellia bacterium]
MTVSCPKCGRKLTVEPRLFGHLLGCPYCMARFAAPAPPRRKRPSGWIFLFVAILAPFCFIAKLPRMLLTGLASALSGGRRPGLASRPSRKRPRISDTAISEREEDDLQLDYDDDEELDEEMNGDSSDESPSRERQYYDSSGSFAGYRDESGWFHGEGGHNYMGYMEDDGSFYDGSGADRGQVEEGGLLWEEGKGYTGSHEDGHFSEEGHYGVPDVYEEGGDGTGGAFDSMYDDDDDDDD